MSRATGDIRQVDERSTPPSMPRGATRPVALPKVTRPAPKPLSAAISRMEAASATVVQLLDQLIGELEAPTA
ncbi:hypothetical protein [Maricaulis sp.]|uniref:hypothetical protein n=1 Tax=Maricaulis sp. TaxID=1486257 RepID=UPI0025C044FB|nr:hypothetical protein [Maricaulis sp.]